MLKSNGDGRHTVDNHSLAFSSFLFFFGMILTGTQSGVVSLETQRHYTVRGYSLEANHM